MSHEINHDNTVDPNGLYAWENDLFGTPEEERQRHARPPMTSDEYAAIEKYCYKPLPNGKSAFENDMLGIPEEERYFEL